MRLAAIRARQPLAQPPVPPAGRQDGEDGPTRCGPDAELPLRVLRRALLGGAAVGNAGPVGGTVGEREPVRRLHLIPRGRVDGPGEGDHQAVFADPETAPISPQLKAALGWSASSRCRRSRRRRPPGDPGCWCEPGRRDRRALCLFCVQPDRPRARRARLRPRGRGGIPPGGTGPACLHKLRRRFGCRHGTSACRPRTPRCVRYRAMGGHPAPPPARPPCSAGPRAARRWSPPDL